MSNVKLHINITQGIIDAEGDQDFVWRVYEDFRNHLSSTSLTSASSLQKNEDTAEEAHSLDLASPEVSKPKRRQQKKRQTSGQTSASGKEKTTGITSHKPRLLNNLDTSGLKEFLEQYKLPNHTDTIVAMTKFLETKGVTPASFDAYFTCYNDAGLKVPEAFGQAFVNARTRTAFIEFTAVDDVVLTIRGRNHIDHGGINKADA